MSVFIEEPENHVSSLDMCALMGVSKYDTPISIFLKKKNKYKKNVDDSMFPIKMGRKLEPILLDLTHEYLQTTITSNKFNWRSHPAEPRFISVPDGFALYKGEPAVVEMKSRASKNDKMDFYEIQTRWHMFVCQYEVGLLGILTGLRSFEIFEFRRNPDIEEEMKKRAYQFLEALEKNEIPELSDYPEIDLEALKKSKVEISSEVYEFGENDKSLFEQYFNLKAEADKYKVEMDKIEAELLKRMYGFNEGRVDNFILTRKEYPAKPKIEVSLEFEDFLKKENVPYEIKKDKPIIRTRIFQKGEKNEPES
jgi:hypothetical protein